MHEERSYKCHQSKNNASTPRGLEAKSVAVSAGRLDSACAVLLAPGQLQCFPDLPLDTVEWSERGGSGPVKRRREGEALEGTLKEWAWRSHEIILANGQQGPAGGRADGRLGVRSEACRADKNSEEWANIDDDFWNVGRPRRV